MLIKFGFKILELRVARLVRLNNKLVSLLRELQHKFLVSLFGFFSKFQGDLIDFIFMVSNQCVALVLGFFHFNGNIVNLFLSILQLFCNAIELFSLGTVYLKEFKLGFFDNGAVWVNFYFSTLTKSEA